MRISVAVDWKDAAKSAICFFVSLAASSWEGKEIGRFSSFWIERRTAVLRPEKEKSRSSTLGWGRGYFLGSPERAASAMDGPPG